MRSLANELGEFGITVNNVMPGYTRTKRMLELYSDPAAMEAVASEIPLGRLNSYR